MYREFKQLELAKIGEEILEFWKKEQINTTSKLVLIIRLQDYGLMELLIHWILELGFR